MDGDLELAQTQERARRARQVKFDLWQLFMDAQNLKKQGFATKWGGATSNLGYYTAIISKMKKIATKALDEGVIDEETYILCFPNAYKKLDGTYGMAKWEKGTKNGSPYSYLVYPDGPPDKTWRHPKLKFAKDWWQHQPKKKPTWKWDKW